MNSKIQKKHCEQNFEKDIDRISDQLKQIFGLILILLLSKAEQLSVRYITKTD